MNNQKFMEEKNYLLALHKIGFNHKKLLQIFLKKDNYKEVYDNINYKNLSLFGFKEKQIEEIIKKKAKINLDEINLKLTNLGVKIITIKDKNYPKQLNQIKNKPFLIYLRGDMSFKLGLAIVGSRKVSSYGEKVIGDFVPGLIDHFAIISGGASGCDSLAHKYTLKNKGKTISIIGTGIDINYPVVNKNLYQDIVNSGGAVLSIFPLGEPGSNYSFPIRNEIIACLSDGLLVVEAALKSGSLITAKLALDLGKDVFAIAGDIYRNTSVGCNNLIILGEAKIVTKVCHITEEYGIKIKKIENKLKLNDDLEEKIYNILLKSSQSSDEINRYLKISIDSLKLKLSIMELAGIIRKDKLGKYSI